jgi:hypothetical protein
MRDDFAVVKLDEFGGIAGLPRLAAAESAQREDFSAAGVHAAQTSAQQLFRRPFKMDGERFNL